MLAICSVVYFPGIAPANERHHDQHHDGSTPKNLPTLQTVDRRLVIVGEKVNASPSSLNAPSPGAPFRVHPIRRR